MVEFEIFYLSLDGSKSLHEVIFGVNLYVDEPNLQTVPNEKFKHFWINKYPTYNVTFKDIIYVDNLIALIHKK
jgi:hypothetical protein